MKHTDNIRFVKGLGEVRIVCDPDDDEGSVLVESTITGKRYWVDERQVKA